MDNYVIDGILTENMALLLDDVILSDLAACSRQLIVDRVIQYLSKSTNEEVKKKISKAYQNRIHVNDIQCDEEIIKTVDIVNGMEFSDIRAWLSKEELLEMRNAITTVHTDEYDIPYINPISAEIITDIINNVNAEYRRTSNIEYKRFYHILKLNRDLFKDKPNASARGTIFKRISRRSQDLNIMLEGIDFLLRMNERACSIKSWRIF